MYSWAVSGSSVFCDWLFFGFSGVSLETAANIFYSSKLPWFWGKNSVSFEDWIEFLFHNKGEKGEYLLLIWRKNFNQSKQLTFFKKINTKSKVTKLYNNNSIFVSPIHTSSLAGNIIVYTPVQSTKREKYFNHSIFKGKMLIQAGKKRLSVIFFLPRPRFFHLSTDKVRV